MNFKLTELAIPGVFLLEPKIFRDHRGYFTETHRLAALGERGVGVNFVQGNLSSSLPYTLRGLHYQLEKPQGKLVRCVTGAIFDVAVDVRRGSPTFGKHVHAVLDEEYGRALYVPPGFAHGFLSLGQPAKVHYECTTEYVDAWSRGIRWDDPALHIGWPLPNGLKPNLSEKDRAAPLLAEAEVFEWGGTEAPLGSRHGDIDVVGLQKVRRGAGY